MSEISSNPNADSGLDATLSSSFNGESTGESPLIAEAIAALRAAVKVQLPEETLLVEERNTWQPESWLIQCCWQTLADAATGNEALEVAALVAERHPNAPLQALYRLAEQYRHRPALGPLLQHELQRWHYRLFHTHPEEANQIERLLLVATSAALADDLRLAAACLERLDNQPKGWERVVARPDLREQLALCVVQIGSHPLINDLINIAIRRFDDAGALLIHSVTKLLAERIAAAAATTTDTVRDKMRAPHPPPHPPPDSLPGDLPVAKWERLLAQCLHTVRNATFVTMQSRRVAAMIMGQAGEVDEVLVHVETIARVQAAQRETGYTAEKDDPTILRQVKRTNANRDADFLVYTLRNAVDAMPRRQLSREDRLVLSDKLALLGIQSDGWTAAGAAATLVALGALRYGVEVIDHVTPYDPARSEGLLMLVRTLLAMGEQTMAAEQAKRALDWAVSLPVRNPERALTWGLAEIYLHQQQPAVALQLLARWREPTGWRESLRKVWRDQLDDDGLRNGRLRLQALLQLSAAEQPATDESPLFPGQPGRGGARAAATIPADHAALTKEIRSLLRTLRRAAPRLLDGEALIHFYIDGLLRPLLQAGYYPEAWALLPDLNRALWVLNGNKQTARVQDVAELFRLLLQKSRQPGVIEESANAIHHVDPPDQTRLQPIVEGFLRDLWRASVARGLWQVVHTIEGTLPLLYQLEGTAAIVAIAKAANGIQRVKLPPLSTPIHSSLAMRTR